MGTNSIDIEASKRGQKESTLFIDHDGSADCSPRPRSIDQLLRYFVACSISLQLNLPANILSRWCNEEVPSVDAIPMVHLWSLPRVVQLMDFKMFPSSSMTTNDGGLNWNVCTPYIINSFEPAGRSCIIHQIRMLNSKFIWYKGKFTSTANFPWQLVSIDLPLKWTGWACPLNVL